MAPLNLPIHVPPEYIPSKNTTTVILVAAAAAAVPIAYLVALRNSGLKRARICHGKPPVYPTSLPEDIKAASEQGNGNVFLASERLTSVPVAVSSLRPDLKVEEEGLDVVLTPYVQATMTAWLDTHGARKVRKAIEAAGASEDVVRSFSPDAIKELDFEEGDVVNGIYHVTHRGESVDGGERVEFTVNLPPGWKGPPINSVIVAGWEVLEPESGKEEEAGVNLVFTNETWMWRRKNQSKTILEVALGRWWHAGVAGWLIGKGIDAVTAPASNRTVSSTPMIRVVPEKQPLNDETETETETETEASEDEE